MSGFCGVPFACDPFHLSGSVFLLFLFQSHIFHLDVLRKKLQCIVQRLDTLKALSNSFSMLTPKQATQMNKRIKAVEGQVSELRCKLRWSHLWSDYPRHTFKSSVNDRKVLSSNVIPDFPVFLDFPSSLPKCLYHS